ncbi:MAG: hypothetical protein PHR26_01210 [Candidatus ainarchaeum sp.]|nr:hypothetical protein [Candidatus ainarchaeum sp.]MDD3976260.1 hypothetical protein [Candidatus ainarchaeum sp.]
MKINIENENLKKIEDYLKKSKNQTIKQISTNLKLNRNTCAKYLEILNAKKTIRVETNRKFKIYNINKNKNIDYLTNYISEIILIYDENKKIVFTNKNFTDIFNIEKNVLNKNVNSILKINTNYFLKDILKEKIINYNCRIYEINILEDIVYNNNDNNTMLIFKENTYKNNMNNIMQIYKQNAPNMNCIDLIFKILYSNENIIKIDLIENNKIIKTKTNKKYLEKTYTKKFKINAEKIIKLTTIQRIDEKYNCILNVIFDQIKNKI